jgi:hypothetical protein
MRLNSPIAHLPSHLFYDDATDTLGGGFNVGGAKMRWDLIRNCLIAGLG